MGCYGIGLGRLLAVIVEAFHDDRGIIWPEEVAPFKIHLLSLGNQEEVKKKAEEVYQKLLGENREVLFDDREESAGVKLSDSDLIGIPQRWVVSEKTLAKDSIEVKKRNEEESHLVKISSI
jgi:prolyl-tRNA synthetase